MDLAKCTLDNIKYKASDFQNLSDLHTKRKYLICIECENPAFFRKASKSGQPPCFGARPHKEGCEVASKESEASIGTLEENERQLINNGNEIKVDFTFITNIITHIEDNKDSEVKSEKVGSSHSSKNGVGKAISTRKLSSLLNMLIHDVNFATSNQKIDIGHKYPYNASTIFKKFDSITDSDINKFKGIYGQIFDLNLNENILWINFRGYFDCSIMITDKVLEYFFNRFNKYRDDIDELNGKYVLCFGKINKSQNNKFYIELDEVSKITFK